MAVTLLLYYSDQVTKLFQAESWKALFFFFFEKFKLQNRGGEGTEIEIKKVKKDSTH